MINKKIFNRLNLNLLCLCLLIIVIIPLNLSVIDNYVFSLSFFFSLISIAFVLCLILLSISLVITSIPFKFNIYSSYSILIGFLLYWVFVIGIFFPVTGIPGPFSLDLSLRLRYIILLKIIFSFFFYIFLIKRDKNYFFFRFIYFFILANIIFLSFNIQNNHQNQKSKNDLSKFGNKNLIVLSFDGISGHKIYEEVVNNLKLNKILKDFKFYKDTVTGGPHTWPSINIEINGKLKNELSKNILDKKNIDTLVYGTYKTAIFDKSKGIKDGEVQNYNSAFELNNFFQIYVIASIGRWATPAGVILVEPFIYTKSYLNLVNIFSFKNQNKLNPYNFIKTPSNINLYEFDLIFDNMTYNKDLEHVIRMYHFGFSHWPIKVNRNCDEVKSLEKTIVSHEHEKIILGCVSKKIIKFLNNLKKNKVYMNSMVVIKSDHAKPNCMERTHTKDKISDFFGQRKCNKYYKNYPYTEKLNNNFYWGFGRYKPFIMIKDSSRTRENIEISNKQVFLHDLSSTYCNFFFEPKECNYLNKNNLAKEEKKFSINEYDIYIPKIDKPLSTTQFEDLKKYTMTNDITFLDFLKLNNIITKK